MEHGLAGAVLIGGAAFVFRYSLFFGYRFIGNSDRWNHYLSFAAFHAHNLAQGRFAAWSEYLFSGFDTLALPFSFFSPLFALPTLLGTSDVVEVFNYVAFGLFACTLVATYWVVYRVTGDKLASMAGACTYTCTTYALLKLAQNDQTYLSIATLPVYFYLIYTTTKENRLKQFWLLCCLNVVEFYFAFLQEFSYNVLFLVYYCTYLGLRGWRLAVPRPGSLGHIKQRSRQSLDGILKADWSALIVFCSSLLVAGVFSAPRLVVQFATVNGSSRADAGGIADALDWQLLPRFFSRDILGRSFKESLAAAGPIHTNLYEGDLLFSSVFASVLFVALLFGFKYVFTVRANGEDRRHNAAPLVLYVLFVFAVMHVAAVYLVVVWLYHGVSFLHSRINVSAMFPVALLVALYVAQGRYRLRPTRVGRLEKLGENALVALVAFAIGLASIFDFGQINDSVLASLRLRPHQFLLCDGCLAHTNLTFGPFLTADVIRTVAISILLVTLLLSSRRFGRQWQRVVPGVVGASIAFQALWGASNYLAGEQTRSYVNPYEAHDFVLAPPDQFQIPSAGQIERMDALLDNADYRSVTVCPTKLTLVDCSNPMGMLWRIRLVDGYLSGIQSRFAALPWASGDAGPGWALGLRNLRFESEDSLPWRVLSFLNVRQAIVMTPNLYLNSDPTLPNGVRVVANPSRYVYPRAYFAARVQSVTPDEDVAAIRALLPPPLDKGIDARGGVDYVEGAVLGDFDNSGVVSVSGSGDRLQFDFPASTAKRFLVVNEAYAPGWVAVVGGRELGVFPTNVIMRGVVVPEGATSVVLEYRSFLAWDAIYTLGTVVVGIFVIVALRWQRRLGGLA